MITQNFTYQGKFELENGRHLTNPVVAYHTFGKLNEKKDNVIWVCHALTASSDVLDWWPGLFNGHDHFNQDEYFIVCANILGSHYGTTGPLSINPDNGKKYYHDFPKFTIRDIVGLHIHLANHLGIDQIQLALGGSMGGQQTLEWTIMQPERICHAAFIATNAVHTPWGAAFNESQRMAIENDPTWRESHDEAGLQGMKVARSIGLLSYRNYTAYCETQQPSDPDFIYPDRAASYQKYQGEKLAKRFNAYSYWHLATAMDSHNVGRDRGGIKKALGLIQAKTIAISLEADFLFPVADQVAIKNGIKGAIHQIIPTKYGHDGFLIETEKLRNTLWSFIS